MSKKCRGLLVASSAQANRGLLDVPARAPLEDGVFHRLVSADDGHGRQGDAEVAGNDRHIGQVPGLAERRSSLLRPYTSSYAAHFTGKPAPAAASAGRWPAAVSPGAPARGDPGDPAPLPVLLTALRHEHIEVRPGLPGRGYPRGEHRGDAILHVRGARGMLRRHARRGVPVLELGGLAGRDQGPIRSPGSRAARPARESVVTLAGPSSLSGRSGAGLASGTGSGERPPPTGLSSSPSRAATAPARNPARSPR